MSGSFPVCRDQKGQHEGVAANVTLLLWMPYEAVEN
jgi:hypothetical protein